MIVDKISLMGSRDTPGKESPEQNRGMKMKCFDVSADEVQEGLPVVTNPYSHVVLGAGGNKRATWVPLGNKDLKTLIGSEGKVVEAGVLALKDQNDKPKGRHLIVAPRKGRDNRVLVLWRVSSGYRGSASITEGAGVVVVASDASWHSGRGNLGETAEMLAVLAPGQELTASRSGRRVQNPNAKLTYDGSNINVTFGGDDMDAALADEPVGKHI